LPPVGAGVTGAGVTGAGVMDVGLADIVGDAVVGAPVGAGVVGADETIFTSAQFQNCSGAAEHQCQYQTTEDRGPYYPDSSREESCSHHNPHYDNCSQ